MEEVYNEVIQNKSAYDRKNMKKEIKERCSSGNYVYIYSLEEIYINYPKKDGNIIYIGKAEQSDKNNRFEHHIGTKLNEGKDNSSNHTISQYYWLDYKIRLRVYKVADNKNVKEIETELINAHLKKYGAKPIAYGASAQSMTIFELNNKNYEEVNKYI
ncbi:hypothetical protein [Clostridium paraputrificum]|uniref:hypothetical protein n=1 Tax=Clostridium paraputrificum TaxID=29363 RepID=UPI00374FA5DE